MERRRVIVVWEGFLVDIKDKKEAAVNRRGSVASGLASLLVRPCSRLQPLVVRREAAYD